MFHRPRRRDSLHPTDDVPVTEQLSFISRHFYKPTAVTPSDDAKSPLSGRRFSILSSGCITIFITMFLILTTVICAVVASAWKKQHDADFESGNNYFPTGLSPFHQAIVANFPDPALIQHNGTWYAFGTNNAAGILDQPFNKTVEDYGKSHIQLAASTDFVTWTPANSSRDPLPSLGSWADDEVNNATSTPRANVWAPDLLRRPSDGKWLLYYSAARAGAAKRTHCIGAAVADEVTGPYTPVNTTIACPIAEGGAIDPAPVVDGDGTIWLAYKIDGNNVGHGGECRNSIKPLASTPILLQRMASDGVTPQGEPIRLLDREKNDGPLVEAPALVQSDEGVWFLFFSSGCTRSPSYDLKYAYSRNITGPYTRAPRRLLKTGDWGFLAPGSVSVARGEGSAAELGGWRVAVHARVPTEWGWVRAMFTAGVRFEGNEIIFEEVV
ncbi:hypothetical protein W97_00255 [Coniosporium apollinis CBS 100218]|uniref:Glycosyl hydrolase family 43 protein n=1 Tax=Coniosporium apollinis (strain CBS 100218) TaxID=1168221 RepID=R7YGV4_CONA1|nr:uncharacterized protein W97_00255 [Coniosporium apollinis CBS 100218]EON61044.1 hypothetical protein W97_00255 [Coniosporium apollinis CBS 100218]